MCYRLRHLNSDVSLVDCVSPGLINGPVPHHSLGVIIEHVAPTSITDNFLSLSFQAHQALGRAKCKGYSPKGPERVGQGRPGMAVIKVKPQPQYTKAALRRQVQGTVTLRVILHSYGRVRDVCVVEGLPFLELKL